MNISSLGVIVFILLSGYMPFSGSDAEQTKKIAAGEYKTKPERWACVSKDATDFTKSSTYIISCAAFSC